MSEAICYYARHHFDPEYVQRKKKARLNKRWFSLASRAIDVTEVVITTFVTMDARIDRDAQLKQMKSQSRVPEQTWYEWFWGIKKSVPFRPTDAATSDIIKKHFTQMLDQVEPPDYFKPSEVAQLLSDAELAALGYEKWEETLPGIYELAFEEREFGNCEILRKGKVIGEEVGIGDLDGPIRIRRVVW